MKNLLFALIGVLVLSCNSNTKILSEKDFTQTYLDSLKRVCPDGKYQISGDLLILANYQGNEAKHFLDNAYKEYKLNPSAMGEVIMRYANSSAELCNEETGGIQINRIVPLIKPVEYIEEMKQVMNETPGGDELQLVYEKYNDQLIIVYGEDTDKNIQYFSEEEFNKLNIGKDTLLQFALRNLKSVLPDVQLMEGEESFGVTAGGDYEASLILLTNLWTKENFNVNGDFLVAIPNRDIMLVTGSNNKNAIERIKTIVKDSYEKGNYPISPFLFKWNGKKFEKFE